MLENFFEGNYHWIVVIIIAIWLLDKLRPDYENKKEKAKRLKEEALKNTEDVKKILEEAKRHDKNPILFYREIIKSEKYRKIFDKKIKSKEYKKILKNLKRRKSSRSLLNLALKIRAQEPDIMKRAEELLKRYPPENQN
tara:strand:- start:833 stop:1249 length:417 start_codon:yes stop_codon:yes gene_type:complete